MVQYNEIFNSIIQRIVIDMMNMFPTFKFSSKKFLHYMSMFSNFFSIYSYLFVFSFIFCIFEFFESVNFRHSPEKNIFAFIRAKHLRTLTRKISVKNRSTYFTRKVISIFFMRHTNSGKMFSFTRTRAKFICSAIGNIIDRAFKTCFFHCYTYTSYTNDKSEKNLFQGVL